METLYDNLLEYYDEIFPVDQDRVAFIEDLGKKSRPAKAGPNYTLQVLDVGCATGTFSLALMRRGMDVTGIDLNAAMIQSACRRNPEPRSNARFLMMNMLEIGTSFKHGHFDLVLCLGNTLVHLDGPDSILLFLRQAKDLIGPSGAFVFQVVNYERVLDEGLWRLPTIESARARFEREYRRRDDGLLSFEATIFSSSGQAAFRDKVALYPATPTEITALAKKAGFKKVELFDDFTGDILKGTTLGVVGVATI